MGKRELSERVREHLELWEEERVMAGGGCALDGELPEETPIEPGCSVRLDLARYHPDEGWSEGAGPVGVIGAINYGRAQDEDRNHWRYYVIWAQDSWEFARPGTKEPTKACFSSERGAMGWPHLWRHDLLTVLRNPWLTPDAAP